MMKPFTRSDRRIQRENGLMVRLTSNLLTKTGSRRLQFRQYVVGIE
jgi:hypothetical protein